MKHTPEPWHIVFKQEPTDPDVFQRTGQMWEDSDEVWRIEGADGFSPCELGQDGTQNKGTTKANTHLIEAVPELLESLKELFEIINKINDPIFVPHYTKAYKLLDKLGENSITNEIYKTSPEEITEVQSTCCGSMPLVDGKCSFCGDKL